MKKLKTIWCILFLAIVAVSQKNTFYDCKSEKLIYQFYSEVGKFNHTSPTKERYGIVLRGEKSHSIIRCSEKMDTISIQSIISGIQDSVWTDSIYAISNGKIARQGIWSLENILKSDSVYLIDTVTCYNGFDEKSHRTCIGKHSVPYAMPFFPYFKKLGGVEMHVNNFIGRGESISTDSILIDTLYGVVRARKHHFSQNNFSVSIIPHTYSNSRYTLISRDGTPVDTTEYENIWRQMELGLTANLKIVKPKKLNSIKIKYDAVGRSVPKYLNSKNSKHLLFK